MCFQAQQPEYIRDRAWTRKWRVGCLLVTASDRADSSAGDGNRRLPGLSPPRQLRVGDDRHQEEYADSAIVRPSRYDGNNKHCWSNLTVT